LEGLDIYGRIILKQILKNSLGGCKLDSSGSVYRQTSVSHEQGSELMGYVKFKEFLVLPRN
jgi:hypothetical protein